MKKNYSLLAHAIHSRLQLIRNRIEIYSRMTPNELIEFNEKYFARAAKSVEEQHQKQCGRYEMFEAAELFKEAFLHDDGTIKNQPMWEPPKQELFVVEVFQSSKDIWYPLTNTMMGGTCSGMLILKKAKA